jgi:anaerobic selenocysteine-containing dehydrogenase
MPDILTTAMWGSWVEINPQTAQELGIEQGDLVEVTSARAALQAPAVLSPGIAPNVVAMPVGQGHAQYGRYATDRGTNPIAILGSQVEPSTGALAWASTRVRIRRLGRKGELCLFSAGPITWGEKQLER